MKSTKELKQLLQFLKTIAKEHDDDIKQVKAGDEFATYNNDDYTTTIVVDINDDDQAYYNFCLKNGLDKDVDNFTISFFHEIGHIETWDDVTRKYNGDKNKLSPSKYFRLQTEMLATKWAIQYCNSNLDEVYKIQELLDKAKEVKENFDIKTMYESLSTSDIVKVLGVIKRLNKR